MYRVYNPYKESSIMSLNMMGISEYKKASFSGVEVLFVILPVILVALAMMLNFMPDLTFLAECQNISGGDICTITFQ